MPSISAGSWRWRREIRPRPGCSTPTRRSDIRLPRRAAGNASGHPIVPGPESAHASGARARRPSDRQCPSRASPHPGRGFATDHQLSRLFPLGRCRRPGTSLAAGCVAMPGGSGRRTRPGCDAHGSDSSEPVALFDLISPGWNSAPVSGRSGNTGYDWRPRADCPAGPGCGWRSGPLVSRLDKPTKGGAAVTALLDLPVRYSRLRSNGRDSWLSWARWVPGLPGTTQ